MYKICTRLLKAFDNTLLNFNHTLSQTIIGNKQINKAYDFSIQPGKIFSITDLVHKWTECIAVDLHSRKSSRIFPHTLFICDLGKNIYFLSLVRFQSFYWYFMYAPFKGKKNICGNFQNDLFYESNAHHVYSTAKYFT